MIGSEPKPAYADVGIERTVNLLGGEQTLHRRIANRLDAHSLLSQGMPSQALQHLVETTSMFAKRRVSLEKAIGVSLRTFQRTKERPDRALSSEQSGRTWKFAEILGRTIELFGSREDAELWLETPAMALDQKPIDLLSTPAGCSGRREDADRLAARRSAIRRGLELRRGQLSRRRTLELKREPRRLRRSRPCDCDSRGRSS